MDTARHLDMSRLSCQMGRKSEMPKQKCISQQAHVVVCRPSYISASAKQCSSAGLSWFCMVSAKPTARKVRLEVRSAPQCPPYPGRQPVLAGAGYESTLGKRGFTLQAWGVRTVNMAFRLALEYSSKDRGQVPFEGCNWTLWIDPNRMNRICFKRYDQASIHCNNKRNLFSFSVFLLP